MIPGLGRSPGKRNGNPLQYSCLENSMDRRVCQATVHGVRKELDMTEYGCILKSYYKYAPGYIENMHK